MVMLPRAGHALLFAGLLALLILVIWLAPRIGSVEHEAAGEREVIATLRVPRLQWEWRPGRVWRWRE